MSQSNPGDAGSKAGWWSALRRPAAKWSLLSLLLVGVTSGILFWGAFNTGMEATNTLEFCIGCHEMRDNVYAEYKETIHYSNRTGVRAVCSDCHVPKDWTHKMIRKAHRLEMAEREWARMKSRDSIECRNCHNFDSMSAEKQKKMPYKKHMEAKAAGKSCIDCHKGIAHKLPKGYVDPSMEEEE